MSGDCARSPEGAFFIVVNNNSLADSRRNASRKLLNVDVLGGLEVAAGGVFRLHRNPACPGGHRQWGVKGSAGRGPLLQSIHPDIHVADRGS